MNLGHIIMHHSLTKDNNPKTWQIIRDYHKGDRIMKNWILTKDELPKKHARVLVATLTTPTNVPSYYSIELAHYDGNNWRCNYNSQIIYEPAYWQASPKAPLIKYQNKPEDCDHNWCINNANRYCYKCGTVQKEIKNPKKYEE